MATRSAFEGAREGPNGPREGPNGSNLSTMSTAPPSTMSTTYLSGAGPLGFVDIVDGPPVDNVDSLAVSLVGGVGRALAR
jgi:hypothetical protein